MVHLKKQLAALVLACAVALALASSAAAAPFINGIFEVPGVETNNKIAPGQDGNMWVTVNNGADDVARITPAGQVQEFELEGVNGATGIAPGPDGNMWVTFGSGVAKFSVANPKGTSVATPLGGEGVNGAESIVAGPDGRLWVGAANLVFNFAPATPATIKKLPVPELSAKDIDVAGSLIVVADSNANEKRIVTFTLAGVEKKQPIPGGSQGLAGSASGQVGFSAPTAEPEQIGVVTPFGAPISFTSINDPQGVALGADGAYWVAQFTPGNLERVTTAGTHTTLAGFPASTPRQISAGPGNTLWVTLDKNEGLGTKPSVARVSGVDPPAPPPPPTKIPQTKLGKHPKHVVKTRANRATVKFRFSADSAGATFQCALSKTVKLKKGKKAPKQRFAGCKSPKTYKLKPGKYRFAVRGVTAAGADASPASFGFKVVKLAKHRHR